MEEDIHEKRAVFIDAFRMRVEDELVFANNVHGNAKDVKLGTMKFGPQARNISPRF